MSEKSKELENRKIEKFEDIIAWQKARELVTQIYALSNKDKFSKDYSLKDQVRRAAVSVMSNISEGFARQTDKEFTQFLYIARGSALEIQGQIYIALGLDYVTKDEFE